MIDSWLRGLYDPSLMECQRTETASAKAAAVADQAEFHFCNRRNAARCFVARDDRSAYTEGIYIDPFPSWSAVSAGGFCTT